MTFTLVSRGAWKRGLRNAGCGQRDRASRVDIADRTPYLRASYDAVLTTPRPPTPPTTTGFPGNEGLSRGSPEGKKASRSRCITEASGRMAATYPSADTLGRRDRPGCHAQY